MNLSKTLVILIFVIEELLMKEVILLFDNVVALVQECIVPIKYS